MANGSSEPQAASGRAEAPSADSSQTPKPSNNSPSLLRKQPSTNLVPLQSPSAGNSPKTSRNSSPVRRDGRQRPLANPIATTPSAAAIQRELSATNVPQLTPGLVSDAVSALPRKGGVTSGETTPQWPVSPRLKSPPPSGSSSRKGSATAQKKSETGALPSISVQNSTAPDTSMPPVKQGDEETLKVQQMQSPAKGPSRGPSGKSTLETVQENSTDDVKEPSPAALQAAADLKPLSKVSEDDNQSTKQEILNPESEKHTQLGESGSDSAGKNETKRNRRSSLPAQNSSQRPKDTPKGSYTTQSSAKSRPPESKQGMTVETETVPSIPQSALNSGDRSGTRNDNGGSVRLKPSVETIRPKKERKKPAQKARSINQSNASSKADIFEARVANAVDEANSSDSDETFVYESNPPEQQRRQRHHSRTPSVTSSHSIADKNRTGVRNFGDVLDERKVAGKRSMKFTNNSYNDVDSPASKDGSVRSHQPRHFGRFGRGGSHASIFDQDSTQALKRRDGLTAELRHSRPNSPRYQANGHPQRASGLFGKKQETSYDVDVEAADDERTPLVGTVRTPRSVRHPRRMNNSAGPAIDEYYGVRRRPRCGRSGGFILGLFVFIAVAVTALTFLVMSNRPMYEVEIEKIQNVLASEQEIMLDLLVTAINPNALGITVAEMDINVFARSKHVGTNKFWRDHGYSQLVAGEPEDAQTKQSRTPAQRPDNALDYEEGRDVSDRWHFPDWLGGGGVDEGTDPDPDIGKDAQTMLLGRIFHFDQHLSFEGSPIKRHPHSSVGQLRLMRPGNKTETGGSERWEKVLQHPFELIIRGVLKYSLPISMRQERAAVGAIVQVAPNEVDEMGNMLIKQVDPEDDWQWIDWASVDDSAAADLDGV